MTPALQPGRPEDAGLDPDHLTQVERLCAGWVETGVTPALQVAVARRGVLALHAAWGRHGQEPAVPIDRDTIFGIASITKTLTAAAVMQLVDAGQLSLTRPVADYVPEFTGDGGPTASSTTCSPTRRV